MQQYSHEEVSLRWGESWSQFVDDLATTGYVFSCFARVTDCLFVTGNRVKALCEIDEQNLAMKNHILFTLTTKTIEQIGRTFVSKLV